MAIDVRIHIEGDPKLRPGFHQFFRQIYGKGANVRIVMCKSNTVADFVSSAKKFPNAANVLLTDSDAPYDPSLIQSIRQHDHWDANFNNRIPDERMQFMVQVMESWFLADRQALKSYYGSNFIETRLPGNPAIVEVIPKADVLHGLESATANTSKGKYHKTKHAPDLLKIIDPAKVQSASPSCTRLFQYLQNVVTT